MTRRHPTRRAALFVSLWTLAAALAWHPAALAENRALLIGIGFYEAEGVELPGVDDDIRMMREVSEKLGFRASQVKILSHSEATLERIVGSIEDWLIDGTTPGDRALFYHSGHGTLVEDRDGDEDDGSDEALLPFDFNGGLSAKSGSKPVRVLLDDDLGRLLARVPAHEVIALVDSCYSGTVTRAITRRKKKFYSYDDMPRDPPSSMVDKRLASYDSVILLAAAKPDQEAQTSRHGALFTRGVYDAVRRSEASRHLTLEELRDETEAYIRDAVGTQQALRHTPTFDGNLALTRLNLFLDNPRTSIAEETAAEETAAEETAAVDTEPEDLVVEDVIPTFKVDPPVQVLPEIRTLHRVPDLWEELELLVRDAGEGLDVDAGRGVFRQGESLEISVVAPFDGYLHVLNVGDGEGELVLLYPNRYQRDNHVRAGETVHIPERGRFRLPARLPAGRSQQRNLVAVIYTTQELNLFDQQPSALEQTFRILRDQEIRSTFRSFRPAPAAPAYAAGQVVVTIED